MELELKWDLDERRENAVERMGERNIEDLVETEREMRAGERYKECNIEKRKENGGERLKWEGEWAKWEYNGSCKRDETEKERDAGMGAVLRKLHKKIDHNDVEAAHRVNQAKRADQGRHECEVLSCGREAAESEYTWKICTKNPGHHKFIPAPEFRLDHLPKWGRHSLVLKYVQLVSALTVRLRVAFTSWERPEGYTFYNYRGSDDLQVASGFVQDVYRGHGPCPCPKCKNSLTAAQEWFCVNIETACHVVFDTTEAEATKADAFYDDDSSQNRGRMKTLFGLDTMVQSQDKDFCVLLCATHDKLLGQELLQYKEELDKTLNLKRWREDNLDDYAYFLCLIVSHPHGRAKHITVGETEKFIKDEAFIKVRYSTDTCCGSSGAPVSIVNFSKGNDDLCLYKGRGPHSETLCVEGKTLNMSTSITNGLKLSGPQWCGRMRDKRVPVDVRSDTLSTVPPRPNYFRFI
ncbi:hypothetical protein PoB_005323300 [Plakobranchus ocellatus]|uniref:Uncharacterized protein n=1 Tax=Plakobranchus ocellatus TaxID=259542 RepID=A0AAV4C6U8_9GAST|nr:hypothetical protein PoB_005323300 [Plakobranchus ocellatus]